ncbi:MAG: TlpA family protein disulfide reductase [Candidatus Rokubacteria bacterium]|nr:TlpA family protein disulfide reductase [Candidatus Rokubacteria bacterium]
MWRRIVIACVLALVPVVILAYGLRANPRAIPSPLVGRVAPEFALPRFDGAGEVRLADLRGRVVVVNFWASWCIPCREEAAALEAVWRRHQDDGVVMVGVNIQDRRAAAGQFLMETRPTYPNVVDATGATSIAYGIYGVPETFVLDREGRIRARHVGAISAETLAGHVGRLVGGGT